MLKIYQGFYKLEKFLFTWLTTIELTKNRDTRVRITQVIGVALTKF